MCELSMRDRIVLLSAKHWHNYNYATIQDLIEASPNSHPQKPEEEAFSPHMWKAHHWKWFVINYPKTQKN